MSKAKPQIVELSDDQLEELLLEASTALSAEKMEQLRQILDTLRFVTNELDKKRVSLKRLKAILFGARSEKTRSPALDEALQKAIQGNDPGSPQGATNSDAPQRAATSSEADGENEAAPEKRAGHGRLAAEDYRGAEREHVTHPTIKPKDPCPKCGKGKLYLRKQPKVIVRMTGSAPVQAKIWSCDCFRCNLCGAMFTATLPEEAGPPEKYDASVTSAIANMHYDLGMPFSRLATFQKQVDIPLPTSTQWDLVDGAVKHLHPLFEAMIRHAAAGDIIHNDDTTNRVLELMGRRREKPPDSKNSGKKRTGIFTTGLVSNVEQLRIALFFTGRDHAGENLAAVLERCEEGRGPLVNMSDGLSRNDPTHLPAGLEVIFADCMAHGRRKYVEIADDFPEQCLHVLLQIGKAYKNDAMCRARMLTKEERLAYHQEYSKPLMDALKGWLEAQMDERKAEPNSGFGEATRYLLKHWERLTQFLRVPGAPLDNNIVERALKRAIRYRKNSLFYKTLHGARVGDIYMSLIHTCHLNDVNPFEYLTAVINAADRVADEPEHWLPWNYGKSNVDAAA